MAEKKEKATIPQYKFFIGSINTVVGQALTETVRNDHLNDINPHIRKFLTLSLFIIITNHNVL